MTPSPSGAARCDQYLDRLQPPAPIRKDINAAVAPDSSPREAITAIHHALSGHRASDTNAGAAFDSIEARLRHGFPDQHGCPELAPPPNRGSMAPHPWGSLNPIKRWLQTTFRRRRHWVERSEGDRQAWPASIPDTDQDDVIDGPDPRGSWQHQGNIRRMVLLFLLFAQTIVATWFMAKVMPYQGAKPYEIGVLFLFAILFCWVSAGFWTAMAGFLVMIRGDDRFAVSHLADPDKPIDPSARTAIVMPICNEDVPRVMAGLRATYESVARTGELDRFDFFLLSDSNVADTCTSELAAWAALCRTLDGFGRIFYRRRRRRVKRKSGNIDDFCRRWGKDYRYMIVLDADSVMSGHCVTKLVRLMEANPGAGIIQTAPRAAGRETLYARIQQFASSVYGPLFTAGLHYWQLGESHYWGHNAIIRMAPFMRHCALSPLPGRGSLAGEIMSHDFVEAALMRRAGWAVWIAYDLDGSYEEMPPNLLDEVKRDRRWCHGNLMNFRLLTARGMHGVHRAVFITGVMAYLSAPLWFLSLAISTGLLALHTLVEPQYFTEPRQLFPTWPQWHPARALALFTTTATLLLLPKILSVLVVWIHGAGPFGGKLRVAVSALLEMVFSMLLAPVRMVFHTFFVIAAFLGIDIPWKSPPRHDSATSWGEALQKHGLHMLLGLAWAVGIYWLDPAFLPWLLPIAGALLLSAPISVWSSRVAPGRLARARKLFLIPEEAEPPIELKQAYAYASEAMHEPTFVDAVVDPVINALVCAAGRPRRPDLAPEARSHLLERMLRAGPDGIDASQKIRLLNDSVLLSQLHQEVWSSGYAHPGWHQRGDAETAITPGAGTPQTADGLALSSVAERS